ncbi:dihydrolipoyl dehydrogenase [Candidatus Thorarchaeota archaeon]|nr:MAG: dihydrolipoyl dehydrogenase [Candidatus Thorarchaeota archaeon]
MIELLRLMVWSSWLCIASLIIQKAECQSMKEYDMIVLGSGAGMNVASTAFEQGMKVAIVERGPLGGTCLLRGCIPTKILTYVADVITELQHAERVNLHAEVTSIDFEDLMNRMREETVGESEKMGQSVRSVEGYDWYHVTGEFVDDHVMKVGDEKITAPIIVLAAGSRPLIPPIDGVEDVDYLTNKTVLELEKRPKSMIIVGGGYIAAELGHFFSAVGTDVTIIGRNPFLVKREDEDVSQLLKEELSKRMEVLTNWEVIKAAQDGDEKTVTARDRTNDETREFKAEHVLVAAGRRSNADLFKPEKTGVETDERGFIKVDDYFRTKKEGIWAFGDAIGGHMFRHLANDESQIVWYNIQRTMNAQEDEEPELLSMSYHAVPRAVFSNPQIATVGKTLVEAKETGRTLLVGKAGYGEVAKGAAMGYPPGFARVICDADTQEILGATVIGPHAPILIHEVINLMYTERRSYVPVFRAMHIHPALSELVQRAFGRMRPLNEGQHHHHHH